jgi:hypothetical protein
MATQEKVALAVLVALVVMQDNLDLLVNQERLVEAVALVVVAQTIYLILLILIFIHHLVIQVIQVILDQIIQEVHQIQEHPLLLAEVGGLVAQEVQPMVLDNMEYKELQVALVGVELQAY